MLTVGVLRSLRAHPPSLLFSNNIPLQFTRKSPSVVRCVQTSVRDNSNHPGGDSMSDPAEHKNGDDDAMSSFGEGYATRSDEEGFGGIYGGNQYLRKDDEDDKSTVQRKDTEFDHKQGSEVKEKEKARNQR